MKQDAGRKGLGDLAPKFSELNDDVLFGEVWSRADKLSLRDRCIITVVALIAKGITDNSLKYHLTNAKNHGVSKEQASGLYAMEMAKRGFLTIAFDPSFTGESGGTPRYMNSPDINTEDFQAAVDYLANHDNVDANKISIIGICGWGGIALNVAQIDTRIKVTITSTMYNMSRATHYGYFDSNSEEDIYNEKVRLNNQRTIDYKNNSYASAGSFPDKLPDEAPWYVKDYFNYYKGRAFHPIV